MAVKLRICKGSPRPELSLGSGITRECRQQESGRESNAHLWLEWPSPDKVRTSWVPRCFFLITKLKSTNLVTLSFLKWYLQLTIWRLVIIYIYFIKCCNSLNMLHYADIYFYKYRSLGCSMVHKQDSGSCRLGSHRTPESTSSYKECYEIFKIKESN